jgi:CHAD domain-containing protein
MSDLLHMDAAAETAEQSALDAVAADVLWKWLDDLRKAMEGAKTSRHIEHVHRMRVACRRLRTALRTFEESVGRKKAKAWRSTIGDLARSLGEVRDLDVQIDFLHRFDSEQADRSIHVGLERLLLRLTQRRDRRQRRLRKALDRFEEADVLGAVTDRARELRVEAARPDAPKVAATTAAAAAMTSQLDEMLGLAASVQEPHDVEGHHQFRIGVKHIRYAAEVFHDVYGEQLDDPIDRLKQLQRILGDLHDCDVWIEFLPRFIDKEKKRTRRFFGHTKGFKRVAHGLLHLLENRKHTRQDIYLTLVEYWAQCRRDGAWDALRDVVAVSQDQQQVAVG